MIKTIPAKTILSGYKEHGWFNSNYNMNLYKGCIHGCIYCDSRSNCYNIENFDEVKAKENAITILEENLKSKKKKGIIMTGAMSDPYNPFEKQEKITRQSLKLIDKYMYGVSIITKSDLVTRDIDILNDISSHSSTTVNITITTEDDNLTKLIEPNAPSTKDRFKAIEKLSGKNINVGVLLTPILPFINDNEKNIKDIVKRAKDCGANWVYAQESFAVSLRDKQREYFYEKLDKNFPNLKYKYIETFHDAYWCASPNHKKLWIKFKEECIKNNIMYDHKEIDEYIVKRYRKEQLSLF